MIARKYTAQQVWGSQLRKFRRRAEILRWQKNDGCSELRDGGKKIEIRLNNEEEMANPYQGDRGVLLLSRFTVKSQILCQNSCHSVTRDERKCLKR